jgi:hypothetical protein
LLSAIASGFLVFAYFATALFQLAIVFGAPLGEYSYGGGNKGKLPTPYRIASVFSFIFTLAIAGHYLAQLGFLETLLNYELNQLANFALVGFAALAAIMNNVTRGKKEKQLWGTTTIVMLVAASVVAFL